MNKITQNSSYFAPMKNMTDPAPNHRIRLSAISDALSKIDPVFLNTPQYQCGPLNEAVGCKLTLKIETANPIRSFKGRGGSNLVASRFRAGALSGRKVIGASAGNWGQALAYACEARDLPLTLFASVNANPLKIEMMKMLGAKVILQGEDFDAAKLAARAYALETGGVQLVDGLDVEASEGAATIAVELMKLVKPVDVVLVPLGNGALLTGIARWVKAVRPSTQVIGVQSSRADAMEKSWRLKKPVTAASVTTIADGIGVRIPVPEALADMEGLVDDVVLVDDNSIIDAMKLLYLKAGQLVEPSGAAGLAAIIENPSRYKGGNVATIICGGNVTDAQAKQYIF
jgi:threonine dehydratase